ncbi:MAG: hypothetical protein V5A34_12065, partial [Halapricum sp.]
KQHPDVSDDPDATRQFKRLTVARDTLLDDDERARYDDLGHEVYLRRHSQADLFDVTREEGARSPAEPCGSPADQRATDTTVRTGVATDGVGPHGAWWRDREGPEPRQRTRTRSSRVHEGRPAATWAQTGGTETTISTTTTGDRVVEFIHKAGGWLLFHLFLIASAVATGWFLYTSTPSAYAVVALFSAIGLVIITVAVAILHLVSIVYT